MAKHILGSTLAFVAGMLIGILLLFVGIGCAAFFIASATTVDKATDMVGLDVFEDDSEIGQKTLWQLGMDVYNDYHNLGNLTVNDLKKYGVKIPDEIEGINLTDLYDVPLKDVIKDTSGTVQKALDCVTVGNIIDLVGLENSDKYPIITENRDMGVRKAVDKLMGTFNDSDTLTIRWVKDNLALEVGTSGLLDTIIDVPLSSLANIIDKLTIGMIIGVNQDLFVAQGQAYKLYAKLAEDQYVQIEAGHELETHANADTCLYSSDDNGLVYKELRYVKVGDKYKVDNSVWSSKYDATKNDKTFYYHISYVDYTGTNASANAVYFHPTTNYTVKKAGTDPVEYEFETLRDYVQLSSIYTYDGANYTSVTSNSGTITFNPLTTYYYKSGDDTYTACTAYGANETPLTSKTRLDTSHTGYIRFQIGTSDALIQSLSHISVNGLNNVVSEIESVKLGDVIKIDDSSTQILKSLKNTTVGGLSSAIDNLRLDSVLTITYDTYAEDPDGYYVLVDGKYELFNPANAAHEGLTRYKKLDPEPGVTVSAKALQALGSATIKNMSTAFDNLSISDVMDINPNKYASVTGVDAKADLTKQYYKYEDGAFLSLTNDQVAALDDDAVVYYVTEKGSGNAILGKLAYLKVNNMANSMTKIVDDTLLTEILTVYEKSIIEADAGGTLYLYEYDADYTTVDATTGEYTRYTFAPDTNGGYYRLDISGTFYAPATALQLTPDATPSYYRYEALSTAEVTNLVTLWTSHDPDNMRLAAEEIAKYYYQAQNGTYVNSYMFNVSILIKCTSTANATNQPTDTNPGIGHTLFKRVACTSADVGAIEYTAYAADPNLFVSTINFGISGASISSESGYVTYDPINLYMAGDQILYRYTNGYYVLSADKREQAETDSTIPLYKFEGGMYVEVLDFQADPTVYETTALYTLVPYYYCPVDTNMPSMAQRYEKVYCEEITIRTAVDDTTVYGYLSTAGFGGTKYKYIQQRSSQVLLSMSKNQVRVGNLGDKLLNFKLKDLITIQPDSILHDEAILNSKLEDISTTLNNKLTNLTISELITLANISKIDKKVLIGISSLKLEDLFGAMEVDKTSFELKVNMLKLFNPIYY